MLALLLLKRNVAEEVPGSHEGSTTHKEDPMPEFSSPFVVLKNDRKLTHQELVRAIRLMIAAEFEAIQLYVQTAESTDNRLAQEVLRDVADEEREHVGEFMRLLKELEPEEQGFYDEGEGEVEEMIEKLKKSGKLKSKARVKKR
jgi:rubrerythrin